MPRSAATHVAVDHVLPVAEIGPMIVRLTHEPPKTDPPRPSVQLAEVEGDEPGLRSDVVCPICQGTLTEGQLEGVTTFRCHVRHAFSPSALLAEQAESLERALWAAVRALEESATMAKRMAQIPGGLLVRLEEKYRTQMHQADIVRRLLLGHGTLTNTDQFSEADQAAASRGRGSPAGD
jgi:two-component system chemotaxis response regulator CheB